MAKTKNVTTSGAESNLFDGSLNEDVDNFHKAPNQWTQARNAVTNSVRGDIGDLSNEAANRLSVRAPYTIIGAIHIEHDSWAIFSTNDTDSEIGIYDEDTNMYTTVVNAQCLSFNRENLIKGVGRTAHNCGRRVYWDDGVNPTRVMDVDNVPWIQECDVIGGVCYDCTDTTELDCPKLRLASLMTDLSFHLDLGLGGGQIINGSYYVVGAYLVEGRKVSDYSLASNVQSIFNHQNVAGSLDITIQEADTNFDEFELVVVQFANFNTVAKRVGVYSTKQKKITLDTIWENWESIDPKLVLLHNPIPDKSDAIFRAGQYMLRVGPTNKFDFNYQPLANQIEAHYVVVEYDADYYRNGGSNTGYMRDETYPFLVRWIYDTGDKSNSYHIPGRHALGSDLNPVSGLDVLPGEMNDKWRIYNTAQADPGFLVDLPANDPGVIIARGRMAYWESTELYPDEKPNIWNATWVDPDTGVNIGDTTNTNFDLCGKEIRHHKFPDNIVNGDPDTNHFSPNGKKIRVLGVAFSNIQPPLDNEGNVIDNIVGYEILRGSREGNKTVLAKGLINNMRKSGNLDGINATNVYPNYPYNPTNRVGTSSNGLECDHFLSGLPTEQITNGLFEPNNVNEFGAFLETDVPLGSISGGNILRDLMTFHSPETTFRSPYLSGKELKVYEEMSGTMNGHFKHPDGHPKHKFITNLAFGASALLGLGYASLKMEGTRTTTTNSTPVDSGGTFTQLGVSSGTTGPLGISLPSFLLQTAAAVGGAAANTATGLLLQNSLLSLLSGAGGVDASYLSDNGLKVANLIASIGGQYGGVATSHDQTEWGGVPRLLRPLVGFPAFLSLWSDGMDKTIEMIYAFTPYRQFALQQVSHCFYNNFDDPVIQNTRREIKKMDYLNPNFQEFITDVSYRVNNLFRAKTVVFETGHDLDLPLTEDDTQCTYHDVFGNYGPAWENSDNISTGFNRIASSHYGAIKQRIENQYGQIDGIIQVPVSTDAHNIRDQITGEMLPQTTTPVLFNGDIYIGRYTERNTMYFFYDWLNGQPDGTVYNYKLKKMILHPRFWMDTDRYDVSEFITSLGDLFGFNQEESTYSDTPPAGSGGFDPFELSDTTSSDPCECGNLANCEYDTAQLQQLCDNNEAIDIASRMSEFLIACACYNNTSYGNACNQWGTVQDPTDSSIYPQWDGFTNPYYVDPLCIIGATWAFCVDVMAGKYSQDGDGMYAGYIQQQRDIVTQLTQQNSDIESDLLDSYGSATAGSPAVAGGSLWDRLDLPSDHYAFDVPNLSDWRLTVKQGFMYLFVSGVRDFYVESEVNIDQRDWGDKPEERHYDHLAYTNLHEIFSTDNIKVGNHMKYDYSLSISKLFNNYISWGSVQAHNYDPLIAETCYVYRPKRVIYSLPQSEENIKDNWQVFLPLNYKDFTSRTVTIKAVSKNGAMMFFENESPIQFIGVDQLQTDGGTKITIGDGGLFSMPMQNIVNAEYPNEYGSCQNRLAVVNTSKGIYYISQNQGKIFRYAGQGLQEISAMGTQWWFAKYLPYVLTDTPVAFLNTPYEMLDNPVKGIGCQVIYDNKNQIVFFTKKDWSIKPQFVNSMEYLGSNVFRVNSLIEVELGDPLYFDSASWTMSFDPVANKGQGGWIGYHDWHPDLVIPSKRTFITTKVDGLWVHADRCDLYCNFYGIDYPFEVEFSSIKIGDVTTLRNVSYYMEAYVYGENCDDRFHVLDFNFDEAIVYNTEQCSGLLNLVLTPKNNAPAILNYPIINPTSIDILFSKEEQVYRFNQFWDVTNDRGEFNPISQQVIFDTEANGYIKTLNVNNINYYKSPLQRKKFRHYKHVVLLRRTHSGNKNMIVSIALQKNLKSSR